jgi:hypothetical protein
MILGKGAMSRGPLPLPSNPHLQPLKLVGQTSYLLKGQAVIIGRAMRAHFGGHELPYDSKI